ncbi:tRNA pseudouridine(55) synthase TruB [Membranihabitans maritimus]|uniref:tRNA pseudouridine(55) synthase TruB n=1 Tax=Membranihabitans maritimus TaxID=2904244 RepID=UPI001F00D039|nr:tRNA pseudouridine(55) synthase TruB [Membranihabitans maritimus]
MDISKELLKEQGKVFLIDKPLEWTSFDVVAKLRNACKRVLNQKKYKVGHAGTLDPLASGLLIICTGKMTKQINQFQDLPKEYTGTIFLGATRPSFDKETPINEYFSTDHITEEMMQNAAAKLTGEIDQKVPIFSAVKVDGQRMYKLARKGEDVKIKSRKVFVEEFTINSVTFPEVEFKIRCSKGTYIRAMADDFGKLLNGGAYLSSLRRTAIGEYSVENAWEIEELVEELNTL